MENAHISEGPCLCRPALNLNFSEKESPLSKGTTKKPIPFPDTSGTIGETFWNHSKSKLNANNSESLAKSTFTYILELDIRKYPWKTPREGTNVAPHTHNHSVVLLNVEQISLTPDRPTIPTESEPSVWSINKH